MTEQPATECIMCNSRINAGTYPPFCCKDCEDSFEIEAEYNAWAKGQAEKEGVTP